VILVEVTCYSCVHNTGIFRCKAYPDGIPEKIIRSIRPPEKCGDYTYELAPIPDKIRVPYPVEWVESLGVDLSDKELPFSRETYMMKKK